MRPKGILLLYTLIILTIFVLAYIGIVPTKLWFIPYFDSIGHFVLYGLWGFFFGWAFPGVIWSIRQFVIPTGILIAMAIAVSEESLQSLSLLRSFSLFDMGWGLLGICIACMLLQFKLRKIEKEP